MRRDAGSWISPVVAALVMVIAITQTLAALGVTGAFGRRAATRATGVPPAYLALDRALDLHDPRFSLEELRDPFTYHRAVGDNPATPSRTTRTPARKVVEEQPVLTAIVWDSDPRALVRWRKREWTVREGGLFDEFQVVSITRDQVSLRRGDVSLVLTRRNPGE